MLKAKRITSTDDVLFQKVMDLYELSFPAVEKRDRADNEKLLGDERFRLLALLDDEIFVGMAGVWDAGGMLYIEHLCTSPELRGKGYGAAALELFKARAGRSSSRSNRPKTISPKDGKTSICAAASDSIRTSIGIRPTVQETSVTCST